MKKKYRVTIVKTVEIETHPVYDNPEFQESELKDFNSTMFKAYDFEDILRYVAGQLAVNENVSFVEGFGRVQPDWYKSELDKPHAYDVNSAIASIDTEDFEVEEA